MGDTATGLHGARALQLAGVVKVQGQGHAQTLPPSTLVQIVMACPKKPPRATQTNVQVRGAVSILNKKHYLYNCCLFFFSKIFCLHRKRLS